MDLLLRMRQANERPEHNADLRPHQILRVPTEGIRGFGGTDVRRLDGARALFREEPSDTLALSLHMRDRTHGIWLQPSRWHGHPLYAQDGFNRACVRKVDCSWPRREEETCAVLAMSLRVRNRAGCGDFKPNVRHFSIMRLHDWASVQRAATPAWAGKQQDVLGLGLDAAEMPEPEQQGLFQVRRARHPSLVRLGYLRRLRARHGANLRSWVDARTHRRERQLLSRQLHVDPTLHASSKPPPLFGVEALWHE
jgi:hypothetical protein